MSVITQPTRLRVPRPVLARPFPRRMEQSVFKTIVEMAYEMATSVWVDEAKEHLVPMLRSVKAYVDKPKHVNGRFPPMRREEGWIREPRYLAKPPTHIVARHEYTCLPRSGERLTLKVSIVRHLIDGNRVAYSGHIHLYRNLWINDASRERLVYASMNTIPNMEKALDKLPRMNLTLILPD